MRGRICLAVAALVSAASVLPSGLVLAPADAASASTTWGIQPSPNVTLPGGQIRSVSCPSATSCTAVGSYLTTSGITGTLSETWDGTSWQKQATPNPAGDTTPAVSPALLGVSCPVAGFCEAVGSYSDGPTGIMLAEAWDGTSWTIQSVPSPAGSTSAGLSGVSCTSATFCEAVGSFSTGAGQVPLAETWNGTSWQVQSVPGPPARGSRPSGRSPAHPPLSAKRSAAARPSPRCGTGQPGARRRCRAPWARYRASRQASARRWAPRGPAAVPSGMGHPGPRSLSRRLPAPPSPTSRHCRAPRPRPARRWAPPPPAPAPTSAWAKRGTARRGRRSPPPTRPAPASPAWTRCPAPALVPARQAATLRRARRPRPGRRWPRRGTAVPGRSSRRRRPGGPPATPSTACPASPRFAAKQ